jgi:hypothetical protein
MNRLFAALAASTFALGSISALGAELTDEERIELRQRAERLQAQGAQNPDPRSGDVKPIPQRDDVRLNPKGDDVRLNQRGDVKTKVAKAKKAKRKKRSLDNLSGAPVR